MVDEVFGAVPVGRSLVAGEDGEPPSPGQAGRCSEISLIEC